MKTCSRCQTNKPKNQFYARKTSGDGLDSQCKECSNAATIASRNKRLSKRAQLDGKKPTWMICRSCERRLRFTAANFMRDKHQPHGLYKRCRDCTNAERRQHRKRNPLTPEQASAKWEAEKRRRTEVANRDPIPERARRMMRGLVERSKRKRVPLGEGVTRHFLEDLLLATPECPCCGVKIDATFTTGHGRCNASPSVDRFDSTEGYIVTNISIICWRCNELKRDATLDELRRIVEWMETRIVD